MYIKALFPLVRHLYHCVQRIPYVLFFTHPYLVVNGICLINLSHQCLQSNHSHLKPCILPHSTVCSVYHFIQLDGWLLNCANICYCLRKCKIHECQEEVGGEAVQEPQFLLDMQTLELEIDQLLLFVKDAQLSGNLIAWVSRVGVTVCVTHFIFCF